MVGLNKAMLIGNVGNDPEIRNLENGVMLATVNIATNESYTDKNGQKVDKTEWHRVVFWRGLAQVIEKYVKKGDSIYVEGRIRNRSYEKDGITRYTTEIQGDNMVMLGGKSGGNFEGNNSTQQPTTVQQNSNVAEKNDGGYTDISKMDDGDDLPF
ncbi:MAG: single-stranded DNA-binding protein [Bacteroidales bacterium]|nr:single-stranded DNA-binding protein [Bacteroidales bacterium]